MIRYALTYIATLVIFLGLDAIWLTQVGGPMYQSTLNGILLDHVRVAPAFGFYLVYVIGIMIFVVPRDAGWTTMSSTFTSGALFGLFCYGTYDLTNYAILEPWTALLAFTDLAWGMVATGVSAAIGLWIGETVLRNFFLAQ